MKKTTDKELKIIKGTTEKLLKLLDIKEFKLKLEKDEGEVVHLQIDSLGKEEESLLIGYYGETIDSLQLLISLIVYKKLNQWSRIVLNISGWREQREESLKRMAQNATQRAIFSGQQVIMPNLNSAERRVIHLFLADHPQVETVSEGEGIERRLVIRPKASNASKK